MPTPDELLRFATGKVRERAASIRRVNTRTRHGDQWRARVQGSEVAPYRVSVNLKTGAWHCSCPDEYNPLCKHVAAVLLLVRDAPESFTEDPRPPRRLPAVQDWPETDVERLLDRLLEHHRALVIDWARVVVDHEYECG